MSRGGNIKYQAMQADHELAADSSPIALGNRRMGMRGFAKDDFESSASVSPLFVASETAIGRSWRAHIFVIPNVYSNQGAKTRGFDRLPGPL